MGINITFDQNNFIPRSEFNMIFATALPYVRWSSVYILDDRLYLPSLDDAKKVIRQSDANLKKYFPESSDCDDFAMDLVVDFKRHFRFCGIESSPAFGLIMGRFGEGKHMMNIMMNDDRKVRLVEPQTDVIGGTDIIKYIDMVMI